MRVQGSVCGEREGVTGGTDTNYQEDSQNGRKVTKYVNIIIQHNHSDCTSVPRDNGRWNQIPAFYQLATFTDRLSLLVYALDPSLPQYLLDP